MPATPLPSGVPFSLTKDVSREYAQRARSRVLPDWANDVLNRASKGQEVDVTVFQAAITQVLSLAATRDGQSMGRRNWTREGRHLAYISQAVIESRLAELPPVEPGQRSPKIAALEAELSDATARLVESENARIEAERQTEIAVETAERYVAAVREQADAHDETRTVLGYARSLLSRDDGLRLDGFLAGLRRAR